jgi:CubicO group peptidase (beta-lactamase class C family)
LCRIVITGCVIRNKTPEFAPKAGMDPPLTGTVLRSFGRSARRTTAAALHMVDPASVTPADSPATSAHAVVPATSPAPWPEALRPLEVPVVGAGRVLDLGDFLDTTSSTSLVVVVDGTLVHERYLAGTRREDLLLGYSATKSALALLCGVARASGALALDDPVTDHVPELSSSGYAAVTVRQVLTMTSGVGWTEDYRDPDGPAAAFMARWRSGTGGMREQLTRIPAGHPPGTRFAYCSPDSMVLDWVRERATGVAFADALAALWQRLGAELDASVGLDAPAAAGGVAVAAGALACSARDWARLGALQVDGDWLGSPVLPAGWADDTSRPSLPQLRPGRLPSTITTHAGFGGHWWPLDDRGRRVTADGMRGQFVYVDRPRRTVVVKTSAWPYDDPWQDRQCRDLCYLALPAIAEAAHRATVGR